MKRIYKYFACALALTGAFSCSDLNETPVFEDSKSFVAFSQTSYSVKEDAGTLSIPVTVASIDAKQVTVAYSVADGTAKKGANFSLADEAAVLVYDGETRTQNIVLNIVNIATTAEKSGYTGDLDFTVTIESAGELDLGYNTTCTVKIVDLLQQFLEITPLLVVSIQEQHVNGLSSLQMILRMLLSCGLTSLYIFVHWHHRGADGVFMETCQKI